MKIRHVTVGPFQENSYLVMDETTNDAILIDPGDNDPRLLRMIDENQATVRAIWLTHAHVDHIGGIAAVRRKIADVPIYMHPLDRPVYEAQSFYAEAYGIPFDPPPPPNHEIAEGDTLTVGTLQFDVLHTPGHAPGHVVYVGHGVMLGGDMLFAGSIGRTDLPLASSADMSRSLEKISTLPPSTIVYPGHGDSTTIATELRSNPFLNGTAYVRRNAN